MTQVIVRPGEPDEYTIPLTYGWEQRFIVGRMRRLLIEVPRDEAKAANLNKKVDQIELDGVDTVRLVDVKTGDSVWELVCYSVEWDSNRAGYTDGGNLREGDDQTLITNLVGEVSSWSAGTINSLSGPLSFVFNHASRGEAIRRIEKNVPGEIQFRDFGTVDYVDRLGTDRSGTVTLSSDAGTIEEDIQITERGRELDGTHIRVLGAHEGEAQLFANLVPQDDPATYENEVRYSTPRWSAAEDTDWDRWANKDVTDQDTIEEEAASLGEELKESLVEAETVVPASVGLNVGDTVRVVKDDADLDREMRVHRLTRQAGSYNSVGGDAAVVDSVLLSTRTTLRTDDDAELEEIQRFNSGFQGASVSVQGGGGRQPVAPGVNAEIPFDYPDIAFENELQLQVRGLPYRAYSSGADVQQGGQFEIVAQGFFDTDQVLDPGDFAQINLPSIPSSYSDYVGYLRGRVITDAPRTSGYELDITINAGVVGSVFSETITLDDFGNWFTVVAEPSLTSDDNASLEIRNPSTQSSTITISGGTDETELRLTDPDHDHSPAPGIIESFPNDPDANASGQLYPTGVDVVINGTTVATDIGSGEFETEVDIAGELTRGAWNDIELTSDTLGHIQATVSIDGYKKIGTQS